MHKSRVYFLDVDYKIRSDVDSHERSTQKLKTIAGDAYYMSTELDPKINILLER